jgi:hypothetical protein
VPLNGGTVCYALSTYGDLETATFLGTYNNCLLESIVNIGDDYCATLRSSYTFTGVNC